MILRYLERTTGYSRQQITRLVKRWRTGKLREFRHITETKYSTGLAVSRTLCRPI